MKQSFAQLLVDSHAHLTFEAYGEEQKEVLLRAVNSQVGAVISVGTDIASSQAVVDLAQSEPMVFAAVGIHPHHVKQYVHLEANQIAEVMNRELALLEQFLQSKRVVAVGEIGLDRHVYERSKYDELSEDDFEKYWELQILMFEKQLSLADRYDKPVIIHSREAGDAALRVIEERNAEVSTTRKVRGVFHCFEGSKWLLKNILEADLYVSMTGNVTYSPDRLEVAKSIPLSRLLLETDSPYMSPVPHRGERNEPAYVQYIAQAHAMSRGLDVEAVIAQTTENARQLFGLDHAI